MDWWIEIRGNQCLKIYDQPSEREVLREIRRALELSAIVKKYDVYLSYDQCDKPIAEEICSSFEKDGIICFYPDRDNQEKGIAWTEKMSLSNAEARLMIIVFTETAMYSKAVMYDMAEARRNKVIVLPFKLTDKPLPDIWAYLLSGLQLHSAVDKPLSESIPELKHIARAILRNC